MRSQRMLVAGLATLVIAWSPFIAQTSAATGTCVVHQHPGDTDHCTVNLRVRDYPGQRCYTVDVDPLGVPGWTSDDVCGPAGAA